MAIVGASRGAATTTLDGNGVASGGNAVVASGDGVAPNGDQGSQER